MPQQNGTGPQGMGPMTGRGMGPCAGNKPAGMGRGFRRNGNPRKAEANEVHALREEVIALRKQVEQLTGEAQ